MTSCVGVSPGLLFAFAKFKHSYKLRNILRCFRFLTETHVVTLRKSSELLVAL